ncbi:GIY-YIG nuclease family protein [Halobacillus ihumii]|uniref:GIY-YIG nuclease family protein n=1 Tax=Halobacillus ihumii TaxID=2686092 RepID=UPI0013D0F9BE|nr:GIY-YIG nuclease family protein [Halobacillus ihumii]
MYIDELAVTVQELTGKTINFIGEPVPKNNERKSVLLFSKCFPSQGVYFFFDSDLNLIYIGASCHLKHRIREHFQNKHNNTRWIKDQFAYAGFIECYSNEVFKYENSLINEFNPNGNRSALKSL